MLGFKIFDGDESQITNSLIECAFNDNLALECALYNEKEEQFVEQMKQNELFLKNTNKSIHLNYQKATGNNIHIQKNYDELLKEIKIAKSIGIHQGVLHFLHGDYENHIASIQQKPLDRNLTIIHDIAVEQNFVFFIENTLICRRWDFMNNLINHRVIWDTIIKHNFQDKLGFCLDWGHVKAFTTDSLKIWLEFLSHLHKSGMPIYMHIHDNNAQKDMHCSLFESFEQKLYAFNHLQDSPFFELCTQIMPNYPNQILILENTSKKALAHYLWLKNYIAQHPISTIAK